MGAEAESEKHINEVKTLNETMDSVIELNLLYFLLLLFPPENNT